MQPILARVLFAGLAGWLAACQTAAADEPAPVPAEALDAEAERAEKIAYFERHVRPLLAAHCHKCHGPREQKGGLRLDSRGAVLAGGDSGPAVVPGELEEGYLYGAVSYGDIYQMPPDGKLPDDQIAHLRRWIEMGAPWPDEGPNEDGQSASGQGASERGFDLAERARHWSFQPLADPAVPQVRGDQRAWPSNAIDHFILARLSQAGLSPSGPAEKRTLLRRVTYDLIGLPPTPEEIDSFLADRSAGAFAKVVDRLLASPHYGERWARHWLDLVRYAETAGHEFDFDLPDAYRYRDYVIRALNADVPYDQFVVEHVAGDLLVRPRRHPRENFNESIIATGFFFLGESKHAPVDIREDEAARIDNQIDVFSKTFLGLGVSCARCHDHKFDAISTRDYYALAGFLQSSRYQQAFIDDQQPIVEAIGRLASLDEAHQETLAAATTAQLRRGMAVLEKIVAGPGLAGAAATGDGTAADDGTETAQLAARRPADLLHPWAVLSQLPDGSPAFNQARQELAVQAGRQSALPEGATLFAGFDAGSYGDWFVTGQAFAEGPSVMAAAGLDSREESGQLRLIEPGMAHSGRLAGKLEGTLRSPTFAIEKSYILYRMAGRQARVNLIIDGFQRIQAPIYGGLAIALDNDELAWRAMDVSMWIGHRAYIEVLDLGPGEAVVDQILFADGPPTGEMANGLVAAMLANGRIKSRETLAAAYRELAAESLRLWESGAIQSQGAEDAAWHAALLRDLLGLATLVEEPASIDAALAGYARDRSALEAAVGVSRRAMAMADGTPENERVFIRGNHRTLGDEVPRRFLEALGGRHTPAAGGSGRLELAERMIDVSADPLLPRVIVNRLWKHHFGAGLVATPDDFGRMGAEPTHPELLDFLAAELVRRGWSLKSMHRLMLLSSAYRMSSRADAGALAADPTNRLLHAMRPKRLEAEAIRDAMLAVSGQLDRALYGPSVPPHLTPFMDGRGRPAHSGPLDGAGRRSIYIGVRRNFLTPMFLAFDFPQPFTTIGRRGTSNVPAQALSLLNNPLVIEQAEAWAARAAGGGITPSGDTPPRDAPPGDVDERIGRMYASAFGRPPSAEEIHLARSFVEEQARRYGDEGQSRAWSDLAHVLFNAKEFIYIE